MEPTSYHSYQSEGSRAQANGNGRGAAVVAGPTILWKRVALGAGSCESSLSLLISLSATCESADVLAIRLMTCSCICSYPATHSSSSPHRRPILPRGSHQIRSPRARCLLRMRMEHEDRDRPPVVAVGSSVGMCPGPRWAGSHFFHDPWDARVYILN